MRRGLFIFIMLLTCTELLAQETEEAATMNAQLEQLAEQTSAEVNDEDVAEQLKQYRLHPLPINTTSAEALAGLQLLSPLQIEQFIIYRRQMGAIINRYELQAIPSWNIALIRKLLPYIVINDDASIAEKLKERWSNGERRWLLRWGRVLEKARGYDPPSQPGGSYYMGNRDRVLTRYTYNYKNLLQWGMLADKDAGEQFLRGQQKLGFDFYSFHFFARRLGKIKSLAIGDFTVNFGQGLLQWQSIAFKKSAAVLSVKRQADALRPYNGAGEYNVHRGAGVTLQGQCWEATVFLSSRKISANEARDSANADPVISALQTGGYHRTSAENADRNGQRQTSAGAQLKYSGNKLHWGISTVYYRFSKSIEKADRPYNLFALQGNNFINAAIDYSYTFRNLHVFGELATDKNLHPAMLSAAVLSLHSNVDAALVYRKMARAYQSVNANAFTENSSPVNEEGFYAGLSIRPAVAWRLDAYADLARFPWLRYRVDAPSTGKDFLVQLNYTPGKQAAAYIRWKTESKWMNLDDEVFTNHHVSALTKNNVRLQLSIALSRALSLDHRAELIINQAPDSSRPTGHSNTQGFLSYLSMACAPARSNWSGNIRLQYFETDGYNERLYAYENDLPYSFSIPFFYDKGIRYYLNLQWDISKIYNASKRKTMRISIGGKWAQTIYAGKTSIGSGLDEINGHRHTEAKLQLIVKH